MDENYVVIILQDDLIEGVYGPFINEGSAVAWADSNVLYGKTIVISELREYID